MNKNKFLYLVKVEPNANNNKYYKMIQVDSNNFEVQYSRIGNTKYQKSSYSMSQWDKKLNEKLKKGYENQTRLIAEPIIKPKNKYKEIENFSIRNIVQRLQFLATQAIKDNYTISSTNVTQLMIDEAQLILNKLVDENNSIEKFNDTLINLFKTIPRKMTKVSNYLANKKDDFSEVIQREQDLLDVMKGQVKQHKISNKTNIKETKLSSQTILEAIGVKIENITKKEEYIIKSQLGEIKNKYYQAWKITNIHTQEKFNKFVKYNNIKNIKLLWHGTRSENIWSILNSGLILRPRAKVTGKMFGYGIYFAPKARKSLGYTSLDGSYWVKGENNSGFMILNDVAYGIPYNINSFHNRYYEFNYKKLQKAKNNANCLHAHAGNMLRNDEIVIYKEEQVTCKYLVELKNK